MSTAAEEEVPIVGTVIPPVVAVTVPNNAITVVPRDSKDDVKSKQAESSNFGLGFVTSFSVDYLEYNLLGGSCRDFFSFGTCCIAPSAEFKTSDYEKSFKVVLFPPTVCE